MVPFPAELSDQLGLGAQFSPAPMTYTWHRLDLQTTQGAMRLHVLVIDTSSGRQGYVFDDDALRAFANTATTQATGLIVAPIGRNGTDDHRT
jgi:hypothetical protein